MVKVNDLAETISGSFEMSHSLAAECLQTCDVLCCAPGIMSVLLQCCYYSGFLWLVTTACYTVQAACYTVQAPCYTVQAACYSIQADCYSIQT